MQVQVRVHACGTVKANKCYMPSLQEVTRRSNSVLFNTKIAYPKVARQKGGKSSLRNSSIVTKKRKHNEEIVKPKCIVDYNEHMGGVNRTDILLSSTESVRKSVKTGSATLLDFQRQVIKSLIDKYKQVQPCASGSKPSTGHSPLQLIERPFPSMYLRRLRDNKNVSKRYIVCSGQKKR